MSRSWDDADDVGIERERSELEALDACHALDEDPPIGPADKTVPTLLFTATNPPGTVSATALIDGRILRVDLSPGVAAFTAQELSDEIALITSLARAQASAAQHVLITEFMARLGHDRVSTRGILEFEIGLPSPESVRKRRAESFAARDHLYTC
ncbi:YbaB/EbfC family DNA-binding protein [Mycolicibacterium austroafricanum]|uniref:YbaB/EbfC family DNA-binding protein n=1 Tax=Mycolicibacterium austroafricanum TaxID=39687 RepID=UPI001ABF40AF|nr:YbaB/EbfC family DNA-binding protein [Mycolicibacterium austroafricanum]QRZ06742.1 YbaB/EbfC family DNA-binding protein [Mycolicibacterium austroafricanum]QZT68227.1 YbaB/EbfC family DNA-binding protein [Mycolicibacterium austroafricanum]